MADHGSRDHALWSASATSRNWACSGALALGQTVDRLDVESEAAGWGTACHQVSEKCLRGNFDADTLIGTIEKTKSHEFEVDEEMAECAQEYIDYVRSRCGSNTVLVIEQRFSLAALKPPFDAGGTCDAIVYDPDMKALEVIDLKGGRGVVVEVTENKQLRTYALGAMLANSGLNVETVISTIVQPRAPHKDGRIRSEAFDVAELLDWTNELVDRMVRADHAMDEFSLVKGDLMLEVWGAKWLEAGDHCTFCPASAVCPELKARALATANAFFNDDGAVEIRNQPSELDPERIAKVLDGADLLTGWLNSVRALAQRLAEGGTEIPGYYLTEKKGRRRWKDIGVTRVTLDDLLDEEDFLEQKMLSPAQVENALGARGLKQIVDVGGEEKPLGDVIKALTETPVNGKTLVSAKSSKPRAPTAAEEFFS